VGDQQGVRLDLYDIAWALAIADELTSAAVLLAAVEAWRQRSGIFLESWNEKMNGETLANIHAGLSNEEFAVEWSRGSALAVDDAVELALRVELTRT
jgi:hypothetical protein